MKVKVLVLVIVFKSTLKLSIGIENAIVMLFPVSVIMTCIVFLFYLNTANVGFAIRNRNTLQPAEDSLICNQHTN